MLRCFALVVLCCAAMAQTPPTGSIAGEVRDPTGKPLADISLVLVGSPDGRQTSKTGAQGEFSFTGLPSGRYQLTAQGISEVLASKSIFLDARQDFKLVMPVSPSGSISGRLLDDKGEPVTSGFVVALRAVVYEAGVKTYHLQTITKPDAQGKYSIHDVKPGRSYRVLATRDRSGALPGPTPPAEPGSRRPELTSAWFPAAASPEEAESLVIFPGELRDNVDIRLARRVPRCFEAIVEGPAGTATLIYQIEGEHDIPLGSGTIPQDGLLRVCLPERGGMRIRVRKGALSHWALVPAGDGDVANLRLHLQSAATLSGVVELEGDTAAPAPEAKISVEVAQGTGPVQVTIPGTFSLPVTGDEPVLDYSFSQASKGYYVKRVACGNAPLLARRLPSSCSPELRITVARDGGTLSVQVLDADGKSVPDVWVVATPAAVASEGEMSTRMWGGPVDALGTFASSIPPGKYLVIATTTWLDLNTETVARFWRARSKATEVEIGPNASVNLRLAVTKID